MDTQKIYLSAGRAGQAPAFFGCQHPDKSQRAFPAFQTVYAGETDGGVPSEHSAGAAEEGCPSCLCVPHGKDYVSGRRGNEPFPGRKLSDQRKGRGTSCLSGKNIHGEMQPSSQGRGQLLRGSGASAPPVRGAADAGAGQTYFCQLQAWAGRGCVRPANGRRGNDGESRRKKRKAHFGSFCPEDRAFRKQRDPSRQRKVERPAQGTGSVSECLLSDWRAGGCVRAEF